MFIKFSPTALKKVFAQNKEIQEMAQAKAVHLPLSPGLGEARVRHLEWD